VAVFILTLVNREKSDTHKRKILLLYICKKGKGWYLKLTREKSETLLVNDKRGA
jgi:hypothetical protein